MINKAPITARTNRILGGNAPTRYLASIESNHGVETTRLDEILGTHLIESSLLRACQLLDLVEGATGKAVVGRDAEDFCMHLAGRSSHNSAQSAKTLVLSRPRRQRKLSEKHRQDGRVRPHRELLQQLHYPRGVQGQLIGGCR